MRRGHMTQYEKKKAWQEIEICCQTLCNKETVMSYIKKLENELELAHKIINDMKSEKTDG